MDPPAPHLRLLFGFLPQHDYAYERAEEHDLFSRVAVVVHPSPDREGNAFSSEVLLALLEGVGGIVEHDRADFWLDARGRVAMSSVEALKGYYVGQPPLTRDPILRAIYIKQGKPTGIMRCQNRLRGKHPPAYQGGIVYSFHLAALDRDAWTRLARRLAQRCELTLGDPVVASERPKISIWTRLYDFFMYDADFDDDEEV